MKIKLLFLLLFVFFQTQGQTPNNSCDNGPILQVDTEYTITNLNTNQYGAGEPIQGHSADNNKVLGFWLKVQVPSGYYAENIEIYDVSNNFNPVIGLKSNCSYAYYPNIGGNDYADENGYGGNEIFHTGLTGPDSIGDGIYHIRIYHYNNNETPPTVDFKIKITDNSTSSEADLSVHSLSIDPTTAIVGENIDLETEIINLGEADVTDDVTIRYFINGAEIDDDDINGNDLPLSQGDIDSEYENNYVFISAGTYQYCVTIDNHPQESNYSNNSMCKTIVVQDDTNCDGIVVTQQPTSRTIAFGDSTSFSVSATGTAPITFQWKKNGTNITGATSSTYTTPSLNSSDNGNTYQCELTNCDGTVSSNVATVSVTNNCVAVDVSQHPQNYLATEGNNATFSVIASGTAPFSYQWKRNGTNITGATNNSYTTPTLSLSDNEDLYSCYITNCNGTYTTTSNSAILTVNTNSPSELTIETINSTFPYPKTLYSGTSNPNYIKVCADGTKSTRLILVNNSGVLNSNIGFRVIPNNSDVSEYGTFGGAPNTINNSVEILYTHPTTSPLAGNYNESRSIEVYDINNTNNVLFTIPLRIYKTPVLMVHGLWGDANGFTDMENHLLNVGYNNTLTEKVNYCENAGNSFDENMWVIPNNIVSLLDLCRMHNFSTGKVDIVSHSMGGILSRIYIQSDNFNNDVNKFITLNSPHSGSPWGNLALNENIQSKKSVIESILVNLFNLKCDASISDGAVYDLAINSQKMAEINSASSLTNNTVPSNTIVTRLNTIPSGSLLEVVGNVVAPELNIEVNDFINTFFDGDEYHDLIVSTSSQQGGLSGNATQLMNGQIWHIGSQTKGEVINHVRFLLQQNPQSNYFEQNGFSPTSITANYKTSSFNNRTSKNSNELIPNSIFINTPIDNSTFNVGETTNVNITSTNGINRIIFYAIDALNEFFFREEFQSSQVDTQYTISNDTYEDISFIALGFNDDGLVDYQIKTIGVNSNITETGIEFLNSEIHIQKDFIAPISINVVYSNGDRKLLTDLSNFQLTVNDINIAEQFESNMLKGNNLGSTTLSASYSGYSISTPIVVYESNVEMPDISTLSNTDFELPILDKDLLFYPNPNNGQLTIKLDNYSNKKIQIEVYNSIGQKIATFENEFTDSNSRKNISLKNLNSGIYFVKVFFGTNSKTGKIVIE